MAKYDSGSIAKMLAYMLIIMKTQKEFKEPAWRLNDIVYRDKAAATRNKKWSQINLLLYNLLFTGRANEVPFYQHYHSTNTFDTCKGALPRKTPGIAGDNSRHCRRNTTPISIRASMLAVQPGQLVLSANLSLSPCLLSMQTLSSPFTALEHLGEGPRPQGQQPRKAKDTWANFNTLYR